MTAVIFTSVYRKLEFAFISYIWKKKWLEPSEAATGGVPYKKAFLEISLNSQENDCAKDSFFLKKSL